MPELENGDPFPTLTLDAVDRPPMSLPGDLEGDWALVVFYRGHW